MAALAKEETSSADFLALGNALEAISTKEKADRERDERGAANAAKQEKRTTKHEWKRVDKEANKAAEYGKRTTERATKRERKRAGKITAEDDEEITRMIAGGYSCKKIASELGKGLTRNDINNRWHNFLMKSSSIVKPFVEAGIPSSITWTAEDNEGITIMKAAGSSNAKIASELGKSLTKSDIYNRLKRFLKHLTNKILVISLTYLTPSTCAQVQLK